jgi:hypothetical protein
VLVKELSPAIASTLSTVIVAATVTGNFTGRTGEQEPATGAQDGRYVRHVTAFSAFLSGSSSSSLGLIND